MSYRPRQAVGYFRVATTEQARDFDRQLAAILAEAARRELWIGQEEVGALDRIQRAPGTRRRPGALSSAANRA
jgi:hypothetical protein